MATTDIEAAQNAELSNDFDSTYGGSDGSDTTSVTSAIFQGRLEGGRRYQNVREGRGWYPVPSDDQQFETMEAAHLQYIILDHGQKNPFFRAPISDKAHNILDLGTGTGSWAIDVADHFPNITVRGVDLYPPPQSWVPPNCILEVDDISKPWTYQQKFDLIHLRTMTGTMDYDEFKKVYQQAYNNLNPGGWIEQLEVDPIIYCDDGTLPADSLLAGYSALMKATAENAGNPVELRANMRRLMSSVGFQDFQELDYKFPVGDWPKHKLYRDSGKCGLISFKKGVDGYVGYLLMNHGVPKPWSQEEVKVYVEKLKKELERGYHFYWKATRVWAQKPYEMDEAKKEGAEA